MEVLIRREKYCRLLCELDFKKTFRPNVSLALSYMFFFSLIQKCLSSSSPGSLRDVHYKMLREEYFHRHVMGADLGDKLADSVNRHKRNVFQQLKMFFFPFHDINSVETSYSFNKEE